ncbi:hydrogenase maturation nickel metallochaperone HypA [Mycolicibacterium sp. YH-1]|uniref:hydrogenase maturation nickel metallochaperone HypA n=1 Tax=Mycolicibacterium sp. YH-1 TaxID=2908837 RepID=UPI001F4C2FAD|nr:hydrogenase maturation nickel metallochaperone HypA [Mycolicibacterium sp. YH-1]UNB49919.1 hydrogenase maturation nickel metallochaperone HypA [Mycolicibacterium sp. YH-1]
MHELSICNSMVGIVQQYAEGRTVRAVNVRIGAMRQIVPETLIYCWSLVTETSELMGAELLVERIPARIRCSACGQEQVLDKPVLKCDSCPDGRMDLVEGDEFLITSLELAEV